MPGSMDSSTGPGNLEESRSFSMHDLENELVDITASSSSGSKVKLLFAKSKGIPLF